MHSESSTALRLLIRLWAHVSPRRRKQFILLLILMLLSSVVEIFSIGAVLPFLGVLTAPQQVFGHPVAQPFIHVLGITEPKQLLLPLTLTFGCAAVLAGAMRLLVLWISTRLSFATGGELSANIYRRTLYQPYHIHVARNSSELINALTVKVSGAVGIINMSLTLIGSAIILIAILLALLSVAPITTLECFAGFASIYFMIIRVTRKQLKIDSQCIAEQSTQVVKLLQEGLGGIRDILIDGRQESFSEIFKKANQPFYLAHGNVIFISQSPRYAMEALGMLLIALVAYALTLQSEGIAKAVPILGAIAFAAQRLLPILQQSYAAWTGIQGGQVSLLDTLALLDQPIPVGASHNRIIPLSFNCQISLKNVSFRYVKEKPLVLKNIDIRIQKGSRVGFIGTTGSGKSTLLDIVMGLLEPVDGCVEIDGVKLSLLNTKNWQAHIAHVPQVIFLSDGTILENIAFGVPSGEIDFDRVYEAARQAQLAELIESWPEGYLTRVGERGIGLSGGQRQRIGIARALYKQADVIVFDEATSALDTLTELAVMQSIESLNRDITVLIIAHRLSTLKDCSHIVEMENGVVARLSTYDDIVGK